MDSEWDRTIQDMEDGSGQVKEMAEESSRKAKDKI